ncbi:MAG: methyl-accepting chemotaxis protein [Gammaproteobacteria bacterium]|nr:methyl-accepting chemotaxis protein [Gammaproteobacteria bacterium]
MLNWKNKLSIKSLTIMNLIAIGVAAIILSIVTGENYRTAALEDETRILSRITEVASNEVIHTIEEQGKNLGADTESDRQFRKAIKKIDQPENKEYAVKTLDDQFNQRLVSTGVINLNKIRAYDKKFNLIAQSSKGATNLPQKLPDTLFNKIKDRKGGDRLKAEHSIWMTPNGVASSVIVPIGGLRLLGYLEVVMLPEKPLTNIEKMLEVPLKIIDTKNKEIYTSKSWSTENEDMLSIDYILKTDSGEPALTIQILENTTEFNNKFNDTKLLSLALFSTLVAVSIGFALFIFTRFVFKPLNKLTANMRLCADGDLTVKVDTNGLTELRSIGESLTLLVSSLNSQVTELKGSATQLASSAAELTNVTNETTKGAQQQQEETEQVATAINEMSATVQEVATHAEEASRAAQDADNETSNGKRVVQETISKINDLENDIANSAEVLRTLKAESENIGSVMAVIQGIAEQTNLLALNAAIEAARAGEQGRGFAVVADEVRVLASRTQESSQEIQSMIDKIQSGASQAMKAMEESQQNTHATVEQAAAAGESLESISIAVTNISDMNAQIASAAEEQRAVADEISRNIENISQISHVTTNASAQTADASGSLADLAVNLEKLVARFKL